MIGTTIPFVVTNDKMEAQKGGMGIDRQLIVEQDLERGGRSMY